MDNGELIAGFCRWLEAQECREKTIQAYRGRVEKWLEYLARHKVGYLEVDKERINYYMHFLLVKQKAAAGTRAQAFYSIKQFYTYLITRGQIEINPVDGAVIPKKEQKLKGSLTNDEIALMINAPGVNTELGLRDTAILTMMASIGARASAICGLRTGDIKAEQVRLPGRCTHCNQVDRSGRANLKGKKKMVVIVNLKEKGGQKWGVPLHDKAAFYLNQYILTRKLARDSDIVFPAYRCKELRPINRHGLHTLVKKYAARVGIKESVTPHSFRRAAITWLLDCGVDEIVVQRLVGHADLSTTEKYRAVTHRAFHWAGIAAEKSLLEAIETPMDGVIESISRL